MKVLIYPSDIFSYDDETRTFSITSSHLSSHTVSGQQLISVQSALTVIIRSSETRKELLFAYDKNLNAFSYRCINSAHNLHLVVHVI